MESSKSSLHPLLTAAAVSVIVLSGVGVASLTGLVPQSLGSGTEAASSGPAAEAAKPAAKPAPRPTPQPGHLGTIQAVREVTQPGEHTALGPIAGGVAGAVIGNQFGRGTGRKIMTVLGAAGGAYAGREVERQARGVKRWEIDVRLDSGAQQTILSEVTPPWQAGERVRIVEGRIQPA